MLKLMDEYVHEDIDPATPGVYERMYPTLGKPFYCLWTGEYWTDGWQKPSLALRGSHTRCGPRHRHLPWRGWVEVPDAIIL